MGGQTLSEKCGTSDPWCLSSASTSGSPAKINGKTVTTRLTSGQAERYREWINNRRKLDQIIAEMDQLSQQV
ncbi:MAG: DUF6788 family protein, partial [Mycobacteriaceae bacterium]